MAAVIADSLHALDCKDILNPIYVTGDYVKLAFEDDPDSVEVRCWPDTAWNTNAEPESVNCYDTAFDLKQGGYIYEIIALWNESEVAHFGSVSYYAYITTEKEHDHQIASEPQTVDGPVVGYGAQAYKAAFDDQTLKDINNWVKDHTDGMIDSILNQIDEDAVMYLINALVFDAEWQHVYDKSDVYKGKFTNIGGIEKQVDMMHSEETVYLQDENAIGFMKPYSGSKYNFAVLLPNEGIDIYEYIAGLTGESLMETLSTPQLGMVMATLPKFSYEYELTMNDVLKELGMPSAFSGSTADFSKMAQSSRGNIYIGDVLHKTFISVDELGTKAGAITKVQMNDESAPMSEWVVTLNRPFIYMIIDNETNLPVFIGTVMDVQG